MRNIAQCSEEEKKKKRKIKPISLQNCSLHSLYYLIGWYSTGSKFPVQPIRRHRARWCIVNVRGFVQW